MGRAAAQLERAREPEVGRAPLSITGEAVAVGIHSVLHSRLAAHSCGGFLTLLPELMYVAVLPYFDPEAAGEEMRAAGNRAS